LKFSLYGAAGGEVTGSGLLIETGQSAVLVDFGLFQGSRESDKFNCLPNNLPLNDLSAVVLTHAHLDHCGRLPLLAKEGYRRSIYATKATLELAGLVLRDAARIAQADLAKGGKAGSPAEPLFGLDHVNRVERLGQPVPYKKALPIAPGVTLRLSDAGHLLGSASVELTVEEDGRKQVVVISGDLGQRGAPLHTDPVPFKHADIVFLECTYGGHDHRPLGETVVEAREIIQRTIAVGGKILVPVFALGRTQQILYLLAGAFQRKTLSPFPVYLDSPMAIEATRIYGRHVDLFDEEALAMYKSGELRKNLGTVQVTVSAAESRALAERDGPCMILAGSGMCNAGRIRLHLKENLPHRENAVLIVGYQAEGTLGRQLVDGAKTVIIDREEVPVRASVHTLGGLSAHAGQSDLLQWLGSMAASRPRVILTHGEDAARSAMAGLIERRFGLKPELPEMGEVIVHP
jgi:metallo-beta-lactamase family protein